MTISAASPCTSSYRNHAQEQQQQQQQQPLLTKKSLALALSAPRAPPVGTAHHALLLTGGIITGPSRGRNGPDWASRPWILHTHHHHHATHRPTKRKKQGGYQVEHEAYSSISHNTLVQRLRQQLFESHHYDTLQQHQHQHQHGLHLPHPHLAAGPDWGDQITRWLGVWLSLSWQHRLRDNGTFRCLCDALVTASVPLIALTAPHAVLEFGRLTGHVRRFKYGPHWRQTIDLYLPPSGFTKHDNQAMTTMNRLIFFIHGGAWGSGLTWFYRLVARPFLEQGWAVAIPGYRTYPDGVVADQVQDCYDAAQFLAQQYPQFAILKTTMKDKIDQNPQNHQPNDPDSHCCTQPLGRVTMMGHSSGAHIALLLLVEQCRLQMRHKPLLYHHSTDDPTLIRPPPLIINCTTASSSSSICDTTLNVDSFVGLSGPYEISHHFDYEAARGVEEISPLKPVCGYTRDAFRWHSPALRLQAALVDHHHHHCHADNDDDDDHKNDDLVNTRSPSSSLSSRPPPRADNDLDWIKTFPRVLLLHAVDDSTVPFTSTAEAARTLRNCGLPVDEIYLADGIQHQDTVMHLMVGGSTCDVVITWIQQQQQQQPARHDDDPQNRQAQIDHRISLPMLRITSKL